MALLLTINNRCEDGRFLVSTSCVASPNPDSLSSSETGVNPGIRSWKKALIWMSSMSESHWCIYFTKKWRAGTLQPGLEFDNFKPRLESGTLKCISWLNGSFLGDDDRGFLRGSQDLSHGTNVHSLDSATFSVFTSIIYMLNCVFKVISGPSVDFFSG